MKKPKDENKIITEVELNVSGSLNVVSGSADTPDTVEKALTNEEISTNLNTLLEGIFNSEWVENELAQTVAPCYTLTNKIEPHDHHWLLNLNLKTLMRVSSGVDLVPIEKTEDGQTICAIGAYTYLVSDDLIEYVGWN